MNRKSVETTGQEISRLLGALCASAVILCAQTAPDLFAQGQRAYAAEDYESAAGLLEQAVRAEPKNATFHYWLAKAYGRRAERAVFFKAMGLAKKTVAELELAVQIDPAHIQALSDLLDYYLRAPGLVGGGEDKAQKITKQLEQLSPAEGHRARALLLVKRKEYAAAESEFRKAVELEPNKQGRLLDLAAFLAERGRYQEADTLYERAAAFDPESPDYLFSRGRQLAKSNRNPQQARQLLERYLKTPRQPDDPPPSEVLALLKRL